ncbi:MAG: YkvA family protein [Deltaproteobacteria bacterium]|nr:YkvA family protein [Deltaproteobacteria bacterium]
MHSSGSWKERARVLKQETFTLVVACRHPRVPWYAKALALLVVGYALSPIDLIPDFIPVLGYLDDLVLIPLGILLVIRLIPEEVLAECRRQAEEIVGRATRAGKIAAVVIVAIWVVTAALLLWLIFRALNRP